MSNQENQFAIAEVFKEKIQQHGWTFCGVFDPEGKAPAFIYTINATHHFGMEILVVGDMHINSLHGLMNTVLNQAELKPGEFTIEGFDADINGERQNLKLAILDVTGEEWLDQCIMNRSDDYNKVYQIIFGDRNNELPTTEGNTDSFRQFDFKPKLS